MKTIKLSLFCSLILSLFLTSCRSEEDTNQDVAVQFKVIATEQVTVKSAIAQIGTAQTIDYQVNGQNWQSETKIVNTSANYVRIASTATAFNQDSELIVQIWIDGKLKVADTAKAVAGTNNIIAQKSLNFNEL